jgi:hypothetical protein
MPAGTNCDFPLKKKAQFVTVKGIEKLFVQKDLTCPGTCAKHPHPWQPVLEPHGNPQKDPHAR